MPIFARAPALKAIGLEGSYKILADFGDAVLAGRVSRFGIQPGAADRTAAEAALADMDLTALAERNVQTLSGGERQKVAIARALVNNPSTIVADEPTGNLDPARSLEIMTLLERINALGTTVVVVTHEKSLVNHFDKRVIMIDHGVVAATGVGRYEV